MAGHLGLNQVTLSGYQFCHRWYGLLPAVPQSEPSSLEASNLGLNDPG